MTVFNTLMDLAIAPAAWYLERNHKNLLGVRRTNTLGRAYNTLKFGQLQRYRIEQFQNHFEELIEENGRITGSVNEIKDGYCIDTSGTLPHVDQLLEETSAIIEKYGGVKRETHGRPFLQNIVPPQKELDEVLHDYPSLLNFATSSELLSCLSNYFGMIPTFPQVLPLGVRIMESDSRFDDQPDGPLINSQLFHLDYHDSPLVYVIVALKDVADQSGPLCLLPASVSQEVEQILDYKSRGGIHHRVPDEKMYSLIDKNELIKFCYPAGTVLIIDSTRCFHYGSRRPIVPRYHLQLAYVTTCRTDFKDVIMRRYRFRYRPVDSRLRKMVLDRDYVEPPKKRPH